MLYRLFYLGLFHSLLRFCRQFELIDNLLERLSHFCQGLGRGGDFFDLCSHLFGRGRYLLDRGGVFFADTGDILDCLGDLTRVGRHFFGGSRILFHDRADRIGRSNQTHWIVRSSDPLPQRSGSPAD